MNLLEQTWRWYGPADPVSLADARQAGATGIVSALHHIPNGEVWPVAEIEQRKAEIEAAGLRWSVVESVPVHEDIKQQTGRYREYLDNYAQTLLHLGATGIPVVCYNFMPVVDWMRTDLEYRLPDGSTALRFEAAALAAFELYLLRRPGAERDFSPEQQRAARNWLDQATQPRIDTLIRCVTDNLPGGEEGYTLDNIQPVLDRYATIDADRLRRHLVHFLQAVVPAAERAGVALTIHPDDPPFPILGLPRVMSTAEDMAYIFDRVPSLHNGLCFCSGSLGVRPDNDLTAILNRFGHRIHFVHLRATRRDDAGNFHEADHLDGDVDMPAVMRTLIQLNQKATRPIPFRPDHGHRMVADLRSDQRINPGYTAIGRLRGLAELRGLERGLIHAMNA